MIVFIFASVSLTHGVTIQCDFQNAVWSIVGTQYTCSYATLITYGNITHVFGVAGDHEGGETNEDVKALYISSYQLNRIPKGIEEFFPNLIIFGWTLGDLTTLTADDLKPFPELQLFYAQGNKLVSLDGDLFKYTPKLILISFGSNLLEHVGLGLLDGLNKLTLAYFSGNPCINVKARTPGAIQELKLKLQNQCPPLSTSPTTTLSISTSLAKKCPELIETLEKEIKRQSDENRRYREENARQGEMITVQSNAIRALEKQIKELKART